MIAAALMGAGSFIIDASPSVYRKLSMDDVRPFFEPCRWEHGWFYALAITLGLWAISALVCTWNSVAGHVRRKVARPSAYGASLIHVTFVLALVAHLWGGLRATTGRTMVGDAGTAIDGVTYRTLRIDQETHPNGMPRSITATLQRTTATGSEEVTVGYNHPITSNLGANELLLGQVDSVADAMIVVHKGERGLIRPGQVTTVAGDVIVLRRFHDPERNPSLRVPVAEFMIGGQVLVLPMDPVISGTTAFVGMNESPMVMLLQRKNPSVPLVLLVCALLLLGVGLVAWERVLRESRSA
jgi:hypothetical protein